MFHTSKTNSSNRIIAGQSKLAMISLCLMASAVSALAQSAPSGTSPVALAQAKPALKQTIQQRPVTGAPANVADTTPAPVPVAGQEQSALGGSWKLNWLRLNKTTNVTIANEKPQPGIVGFDSVVGSATGVECKGGGFAARTLGGVFPAGGDVNMVGVADYVRITTQCASGQIWLEALGVTGRPLQWVGRAVMIDASGARSFESFVMSR